MHSIPFLKHSEMVSVVHLFIPGNTNPYFVSYIRNCSSPTDLQYIDGVWVQACMLMGQGVSMFLGGVMEVKLGPRIATLIGAWFLRSLLVIQWSVLVIQWSVLVIQ